MDARLEDLAAVCVTVAPDDVPEDTVAPVVVPLLTGIVLPTPPGVPGVAGAEGGAGVP